MSFTYCRTSVRQRQIHGIRLSRRFGDSKQGVVHSVCTSAASIHARRSRGGGHFHGLYWSPGNQFSVFCSFLTFVESEKILFRSLCSIRVQARRLHFVRQSAWKECAAESALEPGSDHRPETNANRGFLCRGSRDCAGDRPYSKSERRRRSSAKAHAGLRLDTRHTAEWRRKFPDNFWSHGPRPMPSSIPYTRSFESCCKRLIVMKTAGIKKTNEPTTHMMTAPTTWSAMGAM